MINPERCFEAVLRPFRALYVLNAGIADESAKWGKSSVRVISLEARTINQDLFSIAICLAHASPKPPLPPVMITVLPRTLLIGIFAIGSLFLLTLCLLSLFRSASLKFEDIEAYTAPKCLLRSFQESGWSKPNACGRSTSM